jgi:putative NADH-flavin reductase
MRILILGATGRTGKHLVSEALKNGHVVHVLVRDKSKIHIDTEQLKIFEGLPTDRTSLKNAMIGCEAILSVLNISRTSDFPWAKLRTPKTFLSDTIKEVVKIAEEEKIKRIIVCSAWGANETKKDLPWWFRWFIDNSNIGVAYYDHELQESIIQKTALNYTIVRPVGLTNFSKEENIRVTINNYPKPKLTISRKSVAGLMLKVLDEGLFIKQTVTLSA